MPNIYFYLPKKHHPDPQSKRSWLEGSIFQLNESGKTAAAHCWVWQTWVELQRAGIDLPLTSDLPQEGVVVSLGGFFGETARPAPSVFFAAIAADWKPHPLAEWQVLQNKRQQELVPRSSYIPLWPHPNLIARNPDRGERFEVAAFFGDPENLAPELQSRKWLDYLASAGIDFQVRRADRWHDFSDVDCVIAIRSFNSDPHLHKPPTKLFNAWLAGVPFIGGADSAYAKEGKEGQDYLAVRSPGALAKALLRLKSDSELRRSLVAAGKSRAENVGRKCILRQWVAFVKEILPAEADRWSMLSDSHRKSIIMRQRIRYSLLERFKRFVR